MRKNNRCILILAALLAWGTAAHGQTIMTLKECVQAARKNNIMVKNNENDLKIALEQQKLARSKYLPYVGASAMYFKASHHLIKYSIFSQEDLDVLQEGLESEDPFTVDDFTL